MSKAIFPIIIFMRKELIWVMAQQKPTVPTMRLHTLVGIFVLCGLSGCVGLSPHEWVEELAHANETKSDAPKTLLTWTATAKKKDTGDDAKKAAANGAGKEEEPDLIATDRPDFTEASHGVGRGRVQLEAGYTYTRDANAGNRVEAHSYPETLLRIGMLAEWFELRIGQNFGSEFDSSAGRGIHGASDLYLGFRFDLTEQEGVFPEASLILQTNIPSGARSFSANKLLPGFNLIYGWDVIEDKVTFAGSTQVNRRADDDSHFYAEYAQSFTMGFRWTKRFGQYTEWYGLIPSGANAADTRTQHYLDGGFTYLITDTFQLDIRAGVGLNRAASDFFAGSGFGVRY